MSDPFPGVISAAFSATPTEGVKSLEVQFTDQSSSFNLIDENGATGLLDETGVSEGIIQES